MDQRNNQGYPRQGYPQAGMLPQELMKLLLVIAGLNPVSRIVIPIWYLQLVTDLSITEIKKLKMIITIPEHMNFILERMPLICR